MNSGVSTVEVNVRKTAEGELVIRTGDAPDSTTSRTGLVRNRTLVEFLFPALRSARNTAGRRSATLFTTTFATAGILRAGNRPFPHTLFDFVFLFLHFTNLANTTSRQF